MMFVCLCFNFSNNVCLKLKKNTKVVENPRMEAYYNPYQPQVHQQPQVEETEDSEEWDGTEKKSNNLPFWGNQTTMNLNPLILTNIQNSPYFKVNLIELKVNYL